jgi:sulfate transport system ATP-binding protein
MSIEIRNIHKVFGNFTALKDISLTVPMGELVALLGPSGSGKTTLLRIIAGLENPDSGSIHFDGQDTTERNARDRGVGFVFQHYALFRHMTIFENIAFGLRVRPRPLRPSESKIKAKVDELLRLVQLEGLGNRYPSQLSGGQRQRIALARALAVEPKVLLLDEPFGSLDVKVRKDLRRWLRRLHDEIQVTSLFVTHDQEEALEVADRIVVMNKGRVEQIGSPDAIYDHPANPFVYDFLGRVNLFHGRVHKGRVRIGEVDLDAPQHSDTRDEPAIAYVRPHDIELNRIPSDKGAIEARVDEVFAIGPSVRLELVRTDGGGRIEAELTRERYNEMKFLKGENIFINFRNPRVFLNDGGGI